MPEYLELDNAQRMIRFFYDQLKEANKQHDAYELQLIISNDPGNLALQSSPVSDVGNPVRLDVAAHLEMNQGECLSLFSRLVNDDYLRISGGPNVLYENIPTPVMTHIPKRGLAEIGEVPNPNERLVAALEELARMAEANDQVPESVPQRIRQTATDVNTLSTLGTNAGRLFAVLFGGG